MILHRLLRNPGTIDNMDEEDEENIVTGSSADSDEQEINEPKGKTESQTYQRPRGRRMTEKEAQAKQEVEENARSKKEKKELTAEKNQIIKVRLKMIQEQSELSLAYNLNLTKSVLRCYMQRKNEM